MQLIVGLGCPSGNQQAWTAASSAATQRLGSMAASVLTLTVTPRVGVGALLFSRRDLAMTLLGTMAMLFCSVAIWVDRQLICRTLPSIPPSTHSKSPGL